MKQDQNKWKKKDSDEIEEGEERNDTKLKEIEKKKRQRRNSRKRKEGRNETKKKEIETNDEGRTARERERIT